VRLLVDCSHAYRAHAQRGIDRVVTQVLAYAPAVCANRGVPFEAVAWAEDGSFRIVPPAAAQRTVQRLEEVKLRTVRALERARLPLVRALLRGPYRLLARVRAAMRLKARRKVRLGPGDVLFCPDATWVLPDGYLESLRAARADGVRIVPLFYDLIPLSFPEHVSAEHVKAFLRWLDALLEIADHGLAISRTTGSAVEEHARSLGIELDIFTAYLGADFDAASEGAPDVRDELRTIMARDPYLVVGALEPRKNQELVYRAFELLWERGSEAGLCFAGVVTPLAEPLLQELKESPHWGSRLFVVEGADDEELAFCYANAAALVAPSLAEGFDLPVVEALRHALPVFASRTPVHEEISGESVAYFDPHRPEELAELLSRFERDGSPRRDGQFAWLSWEESVRRMVELLLDHPSDHAARNL
jgi:glycosyltransferase involved in cell wall biosynthesis